MIYHYLKNWLIKAFVVALNFLVLSASNLTADTSFGQNKVQFISRDWFYLESARFKIYFPSGFDSLAFFALNSLNKGYNQLQEDLGFEPYSKIPVIIYPSPNEFYETNVIWDILSEGVGGFTESLKNRVVVPFSGSYREFEHVLRHELTHAFVFDFLYGRKRGGIFSPNRLFSMPLWFAEGLSEFESKEWDIEDDYYVRDLIINNHTEPLEELDGFKAYRQGQALVKYIAEKYGRKKLGAILGKGKLLLTMKKALKSTLGLDEEELYREWLIEAKKHYMPEVSAREFPAEFARRLTDHTKKDGSYNYQPAISPNGEYVAFISDRNGYMSLYLLNIVEGKTEQLISGERSGKYESLHPLWCRVAWHPDGNKIAFVTKRQNWDAVVIYDIQAKNELSVYYPKFGGLYSISFSQDGKDLVMSALSRASKDIFVLNLESGKIERLTSDPYDDDYPVFLPDGKTIVFSSDRPTDSLWVMGRYNLFKLDIETKTIVPLTKDSYNNYRPVIFAGGDSLIYITEMNGIPNLAILNLKTGESYPVTNSVSPVISPSISDKGTELVFASFFDWGWDIYLMNTISPCSLFATNFSAERKSEKGESGLRIVFTKADTFPSEELRSRPYSPDFSPDFISSNLSYSNFYGLQGYTALLLSDVLGNHQFLLSTDLFNNFNNSNFTLAYGYFKPRTPFGGTLFHNFTYYQDAQYRLFSDRLYGIGGFVQYPFNRFVRAEGELFYLGIERKYYEMGDSVQGENVNVVNFTLSGVQDNTLWSTSGPLTGARNRIDFEIQPSLDASPYSYFATKLDLRRYFHFGKGYGFALRLSCGASFGEHPKLFQLGGAENWLNWELARSDIYSIRSMYFSELITPLRGTRLFELIGSKFGLLNVELRYPFVNELSIGFPIPLKVRGLRGAVFADLGTAFDNPETFRGVKKGRLNDFKLGIGFGLRTGVAFLLFTWDVGWQTDLVNIAPHPVHYLTLSAEF